MRRYLLLLIFAGCLCTLKSAEAQTGAGASSVLHSKWWTYYLPITDTITVSFGADSMAVKTSTGAALLQSTFKVEKGVLTLHDYGGQNMCADLAGKYHLRIIADTLVFIMDEDPCDARGGTLIAKRWIRVPAPPPAAVPSTGKKNKHG